MAEGGTTDPLELVKAAIQAGIRQTQEVLLQDGQESGIVRVCTLMIVASQAQPYSLRSSPSCRRNTERLRSCACRSGLLWYASITRSARLLLVRHAHTVRSMLFFTYRS
jgi:hypothetical protein